MDPFLSAHESIDVEKIMASIRQRIQERKEAGILKESDIEEIQDMELHPLPDFLDIPNVYQPHLYPEMPLEKLFPPENIQETGFVKEVMKRIRKIFFPLIRFMIRPIHTELKTAIIDLQRQTPTIFLSKEYIKLLHNTTNKIIFEMTKLKIETEMLKTKMRILEDKMEFLENRERAIEKKFPAP